MPKFKVICPKCGAAVITTAPHALVWELCPGCKLYVWDLSDAMMAEALLQKASAEGGANAAPH